MWWGIMLEQSLAHYYDLQAKTSQCHKLMAMPKLLFSLTLAPKHLAGAEGYLNTKPNAG